MVVIVIQEVNVFNATVHLKLAKTKQNQPSKKKKKNIGNDIEKLEASYTAEFVK